MLIQSLLPDFVLNVQYSATNDDDFANLRRLLETLDKKGFSTQARPGADAATSVLIFIKLGSSSYQELVEKDLIKNYEFGITSKDDSPSDRPRMIYSYLSNPVECGGCAITPGKGQWAFVTSITPISGYLADDKLWEKTKKSVFSPKFPTRSYKKLYGTQVGFYFEFYSFYLGALAILSGLGLMANIRSKTYSLTYAFVNLTWGTAFWLLWKRREAYLANFWGVQNSHKIDEYNAELTSLNRDFELVSSYKHRERHDGVRFLKQLAFSPVALAFVAVLVSYQLGCFVIEIFLGEIYDGPGQSLLKLLPTVMITVFVPILTAVYNIVVGKFLTWETHNNTYTRNDSFVVKTFVLNFLTGYVPLLITSFIYLPFAHLIRPQLTVIQETIATNISSNRYLYKYLTKIKSQEQFVINQERLNGQFFFFMVFTQTINIILKYGLPLILGPVIKKVSQAIAGKKEEKIPKDDPAESAWLRKVRIAVSLPEYNVNDDFRILALQFGYLIMFGPVWTLAPLTCLIFNLISFKLDEVRLASGKYVRPPPPTRIDSIHPWDFAFLLLTWIGSIVSPLVAAFYRHGTEPPKPLGPFAFDKASINISSTTFLIFVLFASEHLFFSLYFVGTKISSFLKSSVEIDNDFVDNDIKLRRDFYSSEVKATSVPTPDDWNTSPEDTLKQAAGIDVTSEIIDSTGALTSYSKKTEDSTLVNRLAKSGKAPEEEDLDLRQKLEAHKEKGDSIIDTIGGDGKPTIAIVDDNSHILEQDQQDVQEVLSNLEKQHSATKAEEQVNEEEEGHSEKPISVTSSDSVNDGADVEASQTSNKQTSKKKSLKRLLKRKS